MSQQTKGRRTPLSLGHPKNDVPEKNNIRLGKATVTLEKMTKNDVSAKQTKNGSSTDEKAENNKSENGQSNGQNNGTTIKKDTGNTAAKESLNENVKVTNDKVKTSTEKDEKTTSPINVDKTKVPVGNDKQKATIDKDESNVEQNNGEKGAKVDEIKVDAKNGDKEIRESVRQKQTREEKKKEKEEIKSNSEKESPRSKEKRKTEITPKTPKKESNPSDSLLAEKSLKGFNENLEEADSMRVSEDSPMPSNVKVLKLTHGPPARTGRSTRSDKLDDASLYVNLSTVSEQSTESNSNTTPVERNYSLRQITGRRSVRPLREISFDHRMRESYQKIQNDFNDSTSSTQATHGSDISRDCFRSSLSSAHTKRNIDDDIGADSPKRSRFDFGLLEFVSSPVTKLRSKFSRTHLSTSTPNKVIVSESADKTEDIPSEIEAEPLTVDEEMSTEPIVDDIEKKIDIETDIIVDDEVPIEIREPRKSRCVIM